MPQMPNPFDRPDGKRLYPAKRKPPKGGVDIRPTEREPKRVAPRQRMPKELESMFPKRPKPKPQPMPMPRGPSKRIKPQPMPYGTPRRKKP